MATEVGTTRVYRQDEHNYTVERFDEITNKKTGETRKEWRDIGYFGSNLLAACKCAVAEGMPVERTVTKEEFAAAVDRVVSAVRELTPPPKKEREEVK